MGSGDSGIVCSLALCGALALCGCGTRSNSFEADAAVSGAAYADTDAGRASLDALDADPEEPLLEGPRCVGFGLGSATIEEVAPAFCGADCSDGKGCPDGDRCWAIFTRNLEPGGYEVTSDIVAYQCFPPEGACPGDAAPGGACGPCERDADCL